LVGNLWYKKFKIKLKKGLTFCKIGCNITKIIYGRLKMENEIGEYVFGNLVTLDDITIEDMELNKIWVNDLSGEDEDGFDETSIRPLLNKNNITKEMFKHFVEISILIKIKDTEMYGSANINEDGNIEAISIWHDNLWENIENIYENNGKIYLNNLVPIFNEKDNVYEYIYGEDRANKIKIE
jgi:hypothetical protein